MTRAGRFLVLDWVNAYSKNVIEADENISSRVRAYHRGYQNIKHERTVTVYQNERWVVEDKLVPGFTLYPLSHIYRLHWLLPDYEWKLEEQETGVTVKLNSPRNWITLAIHSSFTRSVHPLSLSLVRAGELIYGQRDVQPYEGWVSRTYGQKTPALSFAFEITSESGAAITSEFIFPETR